MSHNVPNTCLNGRFSVISIHRFAEILVNAQCPCGTIFPTGKNKTTVMAHTTAKPIRFDTCCDAQCMMKYLSTVEKDLQCSKCFGPFLAGPIARKGGLTELKYYHYTWKLGEAYILCCSDTCVESFEKENLSMPPPRGGGGYPSRQNSRGSSSSNRSRGGRDDRSRAPQSRSTDKWNVYTSPTASSVGFYKDDRANIRPDVVPNPSERSAPLARNPPSPPIVATPDPEKHHDGDNCSECNKANVGTYSCQSCSAKLCSFYCTDTHDKICPQQ